MMIKKQDTDLIEDQAANPNNYGEHEFKRWNALVEAEKERQRREGKASAKRGG